MKYYYAVFKKSKKFIEVSFPDLKGCVTFGNNMEEAYENAVDVLAGWLANAESKFIKKPSPIAELKGYKGDITPVPIDENIQKSYEERQRFNVIFPKKALNELDEYRKKNGMKRSAILLKATEEYILNH